MKIEPHSNKQSRPSQIFGRPCFIIAWVWEIFYIIYQKHCISVKMLQKQNLSVHQAFFQGGKRLKALQLVFIRNRI